MRLGLLFGFFLGNYGFDRRDGCRNFGFRHCDRRHFLGRQNDISLDRGHIGRCLSRNLGLNRRDFLGHRLGRIRQDRLDLFRLFLHRLERLARITRLKRVLEGVSEKRYFHRFAAGDLGLFRFRRCLEKRRSTGMREQRKGDRGSPFQRGSHHQHQSCRLQKTVSP
ncbi:hypothetical protein [Rhizobium sp. 32-5/1]|uniref:hypothetical protein n=1 Tax=Rhizobium sp. 32-5/1 TaxID=3019602 RepID=UPI0032B8348F